MATYHQYKKNSKQSPGNPIVPPLSWKERMLQISQTKKIRNKIDNHIEEILHVPDSFAR